jgi:hypothetical protein
MTTSIKVSIIFLISFFLGSDKNDLYAQGKHFEWPGPSYGKFYIRTPVVEGYILLKYGDTLVGKIKPLVYIKYLYDYIPILPNGKNAFRDIINVPRRNIEYVRIFTDSLHESFTDYVIMDDMNLWRVIARNDSVVICDDFRKYELQKYGEEMFLEIKGKKIKIYGNSIFHTDGASPLILKFINKRYKEHFDETHFTDEDAMIHYILERESKISSVKN